MKFKAIIHILAIALVLLSSGGCGHRASDNPTLLHAALLLENEPDSIKEAKQMLDSLNTSSLDEGDRSLLNECRKAGAGPGWLRPGLYIPMEAIRLR